MKIEELRIKQIVAVQFNGKWRDGRVVLLHEAGSISIKFSDGYLVDTHLKDIQPLPERPIEESLAVEAKKKGWAGARITGLINAKLAGYNEYWWNNNGSVCQWAAPPDGPPVIRWQVEPIKAEPKVRWYVHRNPNIKWYIRRDGNTCTIVEPGYEPRVDYWRDDAVKQRNWIEVTESEARARIRTEPETRPAITDADRDEAILLALNHLLCSLSPSSKMMDKIGALRDKFIVRKGGR